MADEFIRLDTTIIGIDNLINKAETAAEAKVLFKAKDVIYSQQVYTADVQPVRHGEWEEIRYNDFVQYYSAICSECGYESTDRYSIIDNHRYCEYCGERMNRNIKSAKDGDTE